MDDIQNQELIKENAKLSNMLKDKSDEIEKLNEALDQVALPALREYEKYEHGPLKMIAKSAMDKILEILRR